MAIRLHVRQLLQSLQSLHMRQLLQSLEPKFTLIRHQRSWNSLFIVLVCNVIKMKAIICLFIYIT